MRNVAILGVTGSIGTQTLEVCSAYDIPVLALTAYSNVEDMEKHCRKFKPKLAVMMNEKAAETLRIKLADTPILVKSGLNGLIEAATLEGVDTVVTAVVGMIGLRPTLAALEQGKRVALANKETLVCAGELVMKTAKEHQAEIIPIDSEHSAIFQCLEGKREGQEVRQLILTCSGGPFRGRSIKEMEKVTCEDALNHPRWLMGKKISIDSATLMNKGLEFIEAMHLFQMPANKISVVIHPESVIHSMVEYCDHSILAQMGTADMLLPIQYALTYPERKAGLSTPLDLFTYNTLTFSRPDMQNFSCLPLAMCAAHEGGTAGAILNGANEQSVELFLRKEIPFLEIAQRVSQALETVKVIHDPTLEQILEADLWAREVVKHYPPFTTLPLPAHLKN